MHDAIWKAADCSAVSAPSSHWQRTGFGDAEHGANIPRPAHSLAGVQVQRSSNQLRLQAKLSVSHPGDSAEREADRVADAVMQMPEPAGFAARQEQNSNSALDAARKCQDCEKESVQRAEDRSEEEEAQRTAESPEEEEAQRAAESPEEEEAQRAAESPEEEEVQRADMQDDEETAQAKSRSASVPTVTPDIESDIHTVHSAGAPLRRQTRAFFEPRMGADFSDVRVHTGSQATGVARKLNARAFTIGNHITFGSGQYSPSSNDGKRLLAHELTHVVQQRGRGR
ncbi:MAG: DUF4157 domain-containing protein [Proteobacteria bacterium]|nr:DUF4157 domain-containing protein [Pseudomonadota bacterium]